MAEKLYKTIAKNKRGYFDFEIVDKLECGVILQGCEIKSIREGGANLRDCYARVDREELWLIGGYIAPFKQGGQFQEIDPRRNKKLLAHKKEIEKWVKKVKEKGLTLIPLHMYLKGNKVKIEIGLGRSKKLHDKRHAIKDREIKRDTDRARRHY